jgi:hypothetical protein
MTVQMTALDWKAKGDAYAAAAERLTTLSSECGRERFYSTVVESELLKKAETCWRNAKSMLGVDQSTFRAWRS